MGLLDEQDRFLTDMSRLIGRAHDLGFVVTGGELYRTIEQQRVHMREGRSRTLNSQHMKRLAIDLNFFVRDGDRLDLCYDKEVLQALGDYWESLDPANAWGGNWSSFKDTPHFERREGVTARPRPVAGTVLAPAAGAVPPPRPATVPMTAGEIAAGAPSPAPVIPQVPLPPAGAMTTLLSAEVGPKRSNRRDDVETVQLLLNYTAEDGRITLDAPLKPDGIYGEKTREGIVAAQTALLGMEEPDSVVTPGAGTERALRMSVKPVFSARLLRLAMLAAADAKVELFRDPIAKCFADFDLTTPLRQAHFLAQIGHESGELRFQEEIASGAAYEGRTDLGNVRSGDGRRFKGRGLIQLTGRFNYEKFAEAVDRKDEIMSKPTLVAQDLELCVGVAGWYWSNRGLNGPADRDDLMRVTKIINGGDNGIAHRRQLLERTKALYGLG